MILTLFAHLDSYVGVSYLMNIIWGLLLVSGILLLYLTLKRKIQGKLRLFLLLSGASAAGMPVFAILHNLVYALLVHFRGEGTGDEPFFFILAIIVCPIGLLTGLIGSFAQSRRSSKLPV